MRRSRAEAAETRARAVEAAARLFRARGIDGVGLKEIMEAIGMTHGGFYRHFASKDALVAEAVAAAGAGSAAAIQRVAERTPPDRKVAAIVDGYLSPAHVAHPEAGCPVAALAGEIGRHAGPARAAITKAIEKPLGALGIDRAKALFTYAALVGALVLARASDDPKLGEEILAAVRAGCARP